MVFLWRSTEVEEVFTTSLPLIGETGATDLNVDD